MFEFHGWIVLLTSSGRRYWDKEGLHEPELADLLAAVQCRISAVNESSRRSVCLHTHSFHATLTFSGWRNHRDQDIDDLWDWVAKHASRSYGYLFTRDPEDSGSYNRDTQFRVFQLSNGEFREEDWLLEFPEQPPDPPIENRFNGQ